MQEDRRGETAPSAPRWRAPVTAVGTLLALGALIVLVISSVTTTSARIAATTESNGLLSAGSVVLNRSNNSAGLVFDADGLYAGAIVTGCVAVQYDGDVRATLRLSATPAAGTGLDQFIDFQIVELASSICPDGPTNGPVSAAPAVSPDDRELFSGTLLEFWQTHDSYGAGLGISEDIAQGDTIAIQATATVVDDNAAAGRDTTLSFIFESRPA